MIMDHKKECVGTLFFFFQAEDGIRDKLVTGVQTCALPISKERSTKDYFHSSELHKNVVSLTATNVSLGTGLVYLVVGAQHNGLLMLQIGRASCRERV